MRECFKFDKNQRSVFQINISRFKYSLNENLSNNNLKYRYKYLIKKNLCHFFGCCRFLEKYFLS